MGLHIFQQIQSEFVQAQIHNGDTRGHILDIHNFFLQLLKLLLAVFQVGLFFVTDNVIVTRCGHINNLHAGFNFAFQVNVLVQGHIGPEIHQLNYLIAAADTVNSSKPLDNAHGVPVNVVVNQIVAVLKVLALGNTVGGNQNINIGIVIGQQESLIFRNGRETGQHCVQVVGELGNGGFAVNGASDHCGVHVELLLHVGGHILIKVVCCIRKGGEDNHLPVALVDGMLHLVLEHPQQFLQFAVIFGGDVPNHQGQQLQYISILLERSAPGDVVHIGNVNLDLLSEGEQFIPILVFGVVILQIGNVSHVQFHAGMAVILVNGHYSSPD